MLDYQLVQLCKDNRKESKATTANRRAMFRLFAKQLEEKVLTSPLKACNIMQVGGRQREHSTADNGFLVMWLFAFGKWLSHL